MSASQALSLTLLFLTVIRRPVVSKSRVPRAVSVRFVVDKVTLAQEYFGFPLLSFHHCSILTFNLEHYSYQDKVACVGTFQQSRAISSIEK
jgi:hypothetical protein